MRYGGTDAVASATFGTRKAGPDDCNGSALIAAAGGCIVQFNRVPSGPRLFEFEISYLKFEI